MGSSGKRWPCRGDCHAQVHPGGQLPQDAVLCLDTMEGCLFRHCYRKPKGWTVCVVREVVSQHQESVTSETCELGQKHSPGILTPCPTPTNKDIHSRSLYLGIEIPGAKRVPSGHPVSSLCCWFECREVMSELREKGFSKGSGGNRSFPGD